MLEFRLWGIRCRVSLLFPALLCTLMLSQPNGLAVSCLLASLIHEAGHMLVMLLLGVPPQECSLGLFGARIRLGALPGYWQNLLISLAGPLTNGLISAILFLCMRPTGAWVHLLLGGMNLLPSEALDGGEIMRLCLCLGGREQSSAAVVRWVSLGALLPLSALCLWLCIKGEGNVTLLLISAYLVVLAFSPKNVKKPLDISSGCWYNRQDE